LTEILDLQLRRVVRWLEKMKTQQIFEILGEMQADRIADRRMLKGMMKEMNAKADGKGNVGENA
jgi:hypothetical protein